MARLFVFICLIPFFLFSTESIFLKDNLSRAQNGDYAVIAQGKAYTLFHILNKQNGLITIEEITIPSSTACQIVTSWPNWVENNAPQNTSWIHYQIDLNDSSIKNSYSFTKQRWFTSIEGDNFLGTLLQLELIPIPNEHRRKIGSLKKGQVDNRPFWQPKMVTYGRIQEGVEFDGYSVVWPKDGGPLSGKTVEAYFPHDADNYPAYFPYWLQTKGLIGQAKVRIVDSGKGLCTPKPWIYEQLSLQTYP